MTDARIGEVERKVGALLADALAEADRERDELVARVQAAETKAALLEAAFTGVRAGLASIHAVVDPIATGPEITRALRDSDDQDADLYRGLTVHQWVERAISAERRLSDVEKERDKLAAAYDSWVPPCRTRTAKLKELIEEIGCDFDEDNPDVAESILRLQADRKELEEAQGVVAAVEMYLDGADSPKEIEAAIKKLEERAEEAEAKMSSYVEFEAQLDRSPIRLDDFLDRVSRDPSFVAKHITPLFGEPSPQPTAPIEHAQTAQEYMADRRAWEDAGRAEEPRRHWGEEITNKPIVLGDPLPADHLRLAALILDDDSDNPSEQTRKWAAGAWARSAGSENRRSAFAAELQRLAAAPSCDPDNVNRVVHDCGPEPDAEPPKPVRGRRRKAT